MRDRQDNHVFHSSHFLSEARDYTGQRVTVVVLARAVPRYSYELLKGSYGLPSEIRWICRRANIFALEDSPFVNEWFSHSTVLGSPGRCRNTAKPCSAVRPLQAMVLVCPP